MAYYDKEPNAQVAAKQKYADECSVQEATGSIGYSPRPRTLREEAEREVHLMHEQLMHRQMAIAFFTANPAFDEFIALIRKGAISI